MPRRHLPRRRLNRRPPLRLRWTPRSLLVVALLGGCPSDATPDAGMPTDLAMPDAPRDEGTPDDGVMRVRSSASFQQRIAFEGQRLVNVLEALPGEDLRGATVQAVAGAPLVIERAECAGSYCALILAITDATANQGVFIPNPIDNVRSEVAILSDTTDYRGTLAVVALDTIELTSPDPARLTQATVIAASLEVGEEAVLLGAVGPPVRLAIMGDVTFAGTLQLRSADGDAVAGGGAAGEAGQAAGEGADGDAPPDAGGGHATEGRAPGGVPGGGAPRGTAGLACLSDFFESACGGGGGGGGTGPGGAGAGSALIVGLQAMDLGGARFDGAGAPSSAGGGGAGGAFLLGAPRSLATPESVDVSGGAGAREADGGQGRVRVDAPGARGVFGPDAYAGPSVDLSGFDPITRGATLALTGTATAGDTVTAETLEGEELARATADAGGAFDLEVPLTVGLNRLRLVSLRPDGERVLGWSGNNFAFDRPEDARRTLPVSATVDVARLP